MIAVIVDMSRANTIMIAVSVICRCLNSFKLNGMLESIGSNQRDGQGFPVIGQSLNHTKTFTIISKKKGPGKIGGAGGKIINTEEKEGVPQMCDWRLQ